LQAAHVDEFAIALEEYTTTLDVPQQSISNCTATNLLGFEETMHTYGVLKKMKR